MSYTPNSDIYLLNVPITFDNKNQLYFSSRENQSNYFSDLSIREHTYSQYSYLRKEKIIKVADYFENLLFSNYMYYTNIDPVSGEAKKIYNFITDVEYINPNCTALHIELDVFQTFHFEAVYLESFIEREHVVVDSISTNLCDEGLETGEYLTVNGNQCNANLSELYVVIATNYIPTSPTTFETSSSVIQDGVFSSIRYLCSSLGNTLNVSRFFNALDGQGKIDGVLAVFMCPKEIIRVGEEIEFNHGQDSPITGIYYVEGSYPIKNISFTPSVNLSDFGGYYPKNKKLFQYPFTFLQVTNNSGQENRYRFEYFANENAPAFNINGNVSPALKMLCYPKNYKQNGDNYNEGIEMSNFPLCSFVSDTFKNWLAQNSASIALGVGSGLTSAVAGIISKQPLVAMGGLYQVTSNLSSIFDHSTLPNQVRGSNNGSLNCAIGIQNFYFVQHRITREFAERIDKFFDVYGYKVNKIKTPQFNSRPYWNYIKTVDVNITGAIPQTYLQRLKEIFNNGCTFWKSADYVGNYSLNNH